MVLLIFCLLTSLTLGSSNLVNANGTNGTNVTNWRIERFFHLSDIHIDPYYDAKADQSTFCRAELKMHCSVDLSAPHMPNPNGQFGCDTPQSMFNSSLASMLDVDSAPSFILISGDISAHCMDSSSKVLHNINLTLGLLRSVYPNISIFPTIGNNDIYPHNTLYPGPSIYLTSLASVYEFWMGSDWTPEINATFRQGGYYAAHPLPGIRIIGLCTQYWYKKWVHAYQSLEDPANQSAWLEAQLASAYAANEQVLLTGHVPPVGIMESQWESKWVEKFLSLIALYPPSFYIGMFFGHLHRDQFSIIYENGTFAEDINKHMTNLFMAPSYTPRDLSNPAFRIFSLNYSVINNSSNSSNASKLINWERSLGNQSNRSLSTLLGYTQYYYDLLADYHHITKPPVWEFHYNFTNAYGINLMDLPSVELVYNKLSSYDNSDMLTDYIYRWTVNNPLGIDGSINHRCWLCMMTELMPQKLDACIKECTTTSISGMEWWMVLLITLSLVVLLIICSIVGWIYYSADKKGPKLKDGLWSGSSKKGLLSVSGSQIND